MERPAAPRTNGREVAPVGHPDAGLKVAPHCLQHLHRRAPSAVCACSGSEKVRARRGAGARLLIQRRAAAVLRPRRRLGVLVAGAQQPERLG